MEIGGESPRGRHAVRVLENRKDFTVNTLIGAAYDSSCACVRADAPRAASKHGMRCRPVDSLKSKLAEPIAALRGVGPALVEPAPCRRRWPCYWGEAILQSASCRTRVEAGYRPTTTSPRRRSSDQLLQALAAATERLRADFGSWKTPWGDINRFQRLNDDIEQQFDDSKPSIPVGFTSSLWGSLASFGARRVRTRRKWYGTSGNSFVAVYRVRRQRARPGR